MDQVVADHITANTPVVPAIQGRVTCTTTGATSCPVVVPDQPARITGKAFSTESK
jgi:hypothetical protein